MPASRAVVSRLQGIAPTIFAEMSALAVRTDALNLGQGFPDTDGPAEVIEAAARAMREGANQYAPGIGVPALRRAIADHQRRHYALDLDPDTEVAVTTGCTEAIAAALLGLVEPGDEVVVLEPYYDSYVAMLQMAGGVRRPVTLCSPDFRLDVDELRAALTPRTRFVLLNSPHNPTGAVLSRAELQAVADVALENDLVVITDEVYEHLVFDDHEHVPMATLPGMAERTLTLSSIGKSYSLTGWKVGWVTGPADLVAAMVSAKQWLTYTSGAPLQPAAAHALAELPDVAARAGPRPAAATQPAGARAREGRSEHQRPGRHVLRDVRHQRAGLARRAGVLPRPARAGRGRGDPAAGLLRRPGRRRSSPGAVGVLQASRRARGGHRPALHGRPAALTARPAAAPFRAAGQGASGADRPARPAGAPWRRTTRWPRL